MPDSRVSYDREFKTLPLRDAITSTIAEFNTRYNENIDRVRADHTDDGTVEVTIHASSNTE